MASNEFLLSEYEQRASARRIMNDAELLQYGARITANGVLALSPYQLELAQLTDNPLYAVKERLTDWIYDPVEGEETKPFDAWLDQTPDELWRAQRGDKKSGQKLNHIGTMRDVLLLGRDRIADVRGIGKMTLDMLNGIVEGNEFNLTWQAQPTIKDMVQLTSRLKQVPASIITEPQHFAYAPFVLKNKTVYDVIGQHIDDWVENEAGNLDGYNRMHDGEKRARDLYQQIAIFAFRFSSEVGTNMTQLIRELAEEMFTPDQDI